MQPHNRDADCFQPLEIYANLRLMNWRKVLQFTLVHVGVAITAVPVNSTLNRIMITELNLPALLVGVLVAFPYLLSPLQVLAGSWADHNTVWGRHRSPWILIGGLMASFGGYLTSHAVVLMESNFALGLLAAVVTFAIWGLGVNIASVSYLSLLSELSEGASGWRSRAVSVMWTTMIVATIFTSLVISALLQPYSTSALYTAFGFVWLVASAFVLFGAAGIEPASKSGGRSAQPCRVAAGGHPRPRRQSHGPALLLLPDAGLDQHPCPGCAAGAVWRRRARHADRGDGAPDVDLGRGLLYHDAGRPVGGAARGQESGGQRGGSGRGAGVCADHRLRHRAKHQHPVGRRLRARAWAVG